MPNTWPEEIHVTLPARAAALAWHNASLAASKDPDGPSVLYQTLALEWFAEGVRLIGCDGSLLFETWVPTQDRALWPHIGEAPLRTVVVMDSEGFGAGFMRSLMRVTAEEQYVAEMLTITTSAADDGATIPLGAEFMSERLTLRSCGQRIDLRLHEGTYPDWRQLRLGVEGERVEGMTVSAKAVKLLAAIKGASSTDLQFHGELRHIRTVTRGQETEVRGLIMPMRRAEKPVDDAVPRTKGKQADAFGDEVASALDAAGVLG